MQREFDNKPINIKNHTSEDTKDLIRNMLKVDSNDRCNINWILNHPAITKHKDKFKQPISEEEFTTLIKNYMLNTKGTEGRDLPEGLVDLIGTRQQNKNKDFLKETPNDYLNKEYEMPRKSTDYRIFYNNVQTKNGTPHQNGPRGQIFERISNVYKNQINNQNTYSQSQRDMFLPNQLNSNSNNAFRNQNGPDNRFLKPGFSKPQPDNKSTKSPIVSNSNNTFVNLNQSNINTSSIPQGEVYNYNRTQHQDQRTQLTNSSQFSQPLERTYNQNTDGVLNKNVATEHISDNYRQNGMTYNTQGGSKTTNFAQYIQNMSSNLAKTQQTKFNLNDSTLQHGNNQFLHTNNLSTPLQNPSQLNMMSERSIPTTRLHNQDPTVNKVLEDAQRQGFSKAYQPNQFSNVRYEPESSKNIKGSHELAVPRDNGNKPNSQFVQSNTVKQPVETSRVNIDNDYSLTTRRVTFDQPRPNMQFQESQAKKQEDNRNETDRNSQNQVTYRYIFKDGNLAKEPIDNSANMSKALPKSFSTTMIKTNPQVTSDLNNKNEPSNFKSFVFTQPNKLVKLDDAELKKLDVQLANKNALSNINTKNLSTSDLNAYRKLYAESQNQTNVTYDSGLNVNSLVSKRFLDLPDKNNGRVLTNNNMSFNGVTQIRRS